MAAVPSIAEAGNSSLEEFTPNVVDGCFCIRGPIIMGVGLIIAYVGKMAHTCRTRCACGNHNI
jgi:hypothetical protein